MSQNQKKKRPATAQGNAKAKAGNVMPRDVTAVAAERQRSMVHASILAEANALEDKAFEEGMALLRDSASAEYVVRTLAPKVAEVERVRATAERFAPSLTLSA